MYSRLFGNLRRKCTYYIFEMITKLDLKLFVFEFEFQFNPFIKEGLGQNTIFSGTVTSRKQYFFWVILKKTTTHQHIQMVNV